MPRAVSGAPGAADVLKRIDAENIRNLRLVLTDLYGVPRGKVITAHRIGRAVTDGHPFGDPVVRIQFVAAARARRARLQP